MTQIIEVWSEPRSDKVIVLANNEPAGVTGPVGPIIKMYRQERRFQCIKRGPTGESRVLIEVTDDPQLESVGQSSAVWMPLGYFIINSTTASVTVEGDIISNPEGANNYLSCGFCHTCAWLYVRCNIIAHTGDPIMVLFGV